MNRFSSDTNKLFLILIFIVTSLFAVKTYFDILSDRDLAIASTERSAKSFVSELNEHVSHMFSDSENVLIDIAQDMERLPKHSSGDESAIHRILAGYHGSRPFISNLFISAPNGTMTAHSVAYPVRKAATANREFVRHHNNFLNSDMFVSSAIRNPDDTSWGITLTKGIINPDGNLRMIVGMTVDLTYFSSFFYSNDLAINDRIILLRRDGTVLTEEPFSRSILGPTPLTTRLTEKELPNAPFMGTFLAGDTAGAPANRVVSYFTSEDYPLVSVVSLYLPDALRQWRHRAINSAGAALLLVLLVGAFGLLINHQVKELKRSEDKFSLIVKTANEGIWLLDPETRITYINQRVADMFGYQPHEIMGKPLSNFMHPEELPDYAVKLQRRKQGLSERYERRFLHKNGSTVWTMVSSTPIFDESTHFQGVVAMCTNITDRKKIEAQQARMADQLRQAHKLESIGILAGGIAHDFNNVLQSILSYIFLAKTAITPGSEAEDYLEKAETISNQACELGKRLLLLSRGGITFKREVQLAPIIVESVNSVLKESSIVVEYDIPDDLPMVSVDESHMGQVFTHLATNTLESIRGEGTVRIACAALMITDKSELPLPQGYYIHVTFSDTGSGIPTENLPKIFDPYFTTKEMWSQRGLGLGLALCHTIIRKHNGIITAESTSGKGTTMHVYLPAAGSEAVAGQPDNGLQLSLSL